MQAMGRFVLSKQADKAYCRYSQTATQNLTQSISFQGGPEMHTPETCVAPILMAKTPPGRQSLTLGIEYAILTKDYYWFS